MKPTAILPLEETGNNSPVPGIRQQHSANNTRDHGGMQKKQSDSDTASDAYDEF